MSFTCMPSLRSNAPHKITVQSVIDHSDAFVVLNDKLFEEFFELLS